MLEHSGGFCSGCACRVYRYVSQLNSVCLRGPSALVAFPPSSSPWARRQELRLRRINLRRRRSRTWAVRPPSSDSRGTRWTLRCWRGAGATLKCHAWAWALKYVRRRFRMAVPVQCTVRCTCGGGGDRAVPSPWLRYLLLHGTIGLLFTVLNTLCCLGHLCCCSENSGCYLGFLVW